MCFYCFYKPGQSLSCEKNSKTKNFKNETERTAQNGSDLNRLRRKLKVDWAVENATETPEKRQPASQPTTGRNTGKHYYQQQQHIRAKKKTTTTKKRVKSRDKQRRETERNGNERGKVTCQLCPFSHSLSLALPPHCLLGPPHHHTLFLAATLFRSLQLGGLPLMERLGKWNKQRRKEKSEENMQLHTERSGWGPLRTFLCASHCF